MINSFEPIIDKDCKILILGTMPGIQSIEKQEYYGNKRNSFWKIVFFLFDQDISSNYQYKKEFLLQHKIALWDVIKSCDREGSSDSAIKNPTPNELNKILEKYPNIKAIYFNGGQAEKFFNRLIAKTISNRSIEFHRLPSTSPANTVKFEQKFEHWKLILNDLI